jgi:hypothetical protein
MGKWTWGNRQEAFPESTVTSRNSRNRESGAITCIPVSALDVRLQAHDAKGTKGTASNEPD